MKPFAPKEITVQAKSHKYGAERTTVDGRSFASKKEARRYSALKLLERAGDIVELSIQPRFPIKINNVLVTTYVADFVYVDRRCGKTIIEDAKGFKTPIYKLKKKLMLAVHGIEVLET